MRILFVSLFLNLLLCMQATAQNVPANNLDDVKKLAENMLNHRYNRNAWQIFFASKEFLETEIVTHPDSADAWYYFGLLDSRSFTRDKAEDAFKKAIELKPDFAEAYNALGWYYQYPSGCGNHYLDRSNKERDLYNNQAVEQHKKAIELKPDYADAYRGLGSSYFTMERYDEAIKSYENVLSLNQGIGRDYEQLAEAYEQLGSYEKAIAVYTQLIDFNLNQVGKDADAARQARLEIFFAYENIGDCYTQMGDYPNAISAYKRLVELNLDLSRIHLKLGKTYITLGDKESALAEHKILVGMTKKYANSTAESILSGIAQKEAGELLRLIQK